MTGERIILGWYPDPEARFDLRFWDGSGWTEHVVRGGVSAVDRPPETSGAWSPYLPVARIASAKRRRPRRIVVIVLAIVAALVAAVALYVVANRTVFTDRLLAVDFRNGPGPFLTNDTPDYSLQVVDGTYRIQSRTAQVAPQSSFAMFARTAYVVNITADVASVSPDSSFGVGCLSAPGRGYIFVALTTGVVHLERVDNRTESNNRRIADKQTPVPSGDLTLRLACRDNPGSSVSLTGYVSGQEVITGRDAHGLDGFRAGVLLFRNPAADAEVRYRSVHATVSEPAAGK